MVQTYCAYYQIVIRLLKVSKYKQLPFCCVITNKTDTVILRFARKTRGARWCSGYATNRQVAGSIPDGVIGIFQ